MKKIWSEIPKTFRVTLIASFVLVIAVSIGAGMIKNATFGLQTTIAGGFSVALLCAYVVWISRVMVSTRSKIEESGDAESVSSAAAMKIQVGSLVKLLILAAFLITLIVVFKFDVYSAILGVSVIYVPLFIVPLFVKSDAKGAKSGKTDADGGEDSGNSEVQSNV